MTRKLLVLACLLLALATWGIAAEPMSVTIMTQNMDAGTDLTYAIYGLLGYIDLSTGVELTYKEIQATAIAQRASKSAYRRRFRIPPHKRIGRNCRQSPRPILDRRPEF